MEHLKHTTELLELKDKNIRILLVLNHRTHLEVHAKLDYLAPSCPHCHGKMIKYDFQKQSKIPILDCQGFPTVLMLKKRRFQCKQCRRVVVAQTPLVKKNHQISVPVKQKITQLLVEKQALTHIAHRLAVSTSTVLRQLKAFEWTTNWQTLPEVMSGESNSLGIDCLSCLQEGENELYCPGF